MQKKLLLSLFMVLALSWPMGAVSLPKEPSWKPFGIMSLNYRAIGQKPLEVEIENQFLLSDIFLGLSGPVLEGFPFLLEFSFDSDGKPQLYRFTVRNEKWKYADLEAGRFLIPYGRFNELYRPDMVVSITRPLLYASPNGLDFISRVSYPRPLVSSGYVDTGLKFGLFPPPERAWLPHQISFYVVNGLQESPEIGRAPPRPRSFNIPQSSNGVDIDFGHERNSLSDNNDNKVLGLRLRYNFGDFRVPFPFKEGGAHVQGFNLGFSSLYGVYDIEDKLQYHLLGFDTAFQLGEFQISGEMGYSPSQYSVVLTTQTTVASISDIDTLNRGIGRQVIWGYYVQTIFPFWEPPFSKQTNGFFRFDQLFRHGAELRDVNVADSSAFATYSDLSPNHPHVNRHINKYSFGFNNRLSKNFNFKIEFSYWDLHKARDIYQGLWAAVVSF